MDALAATDIFLGEGFRLDRRGGVLFRRDRQGVFAPIAIGSGRSTFSTCWSSGRATRLEKPDHRGRLAGNDSRRQQPQRPDRSIAPHR
jgi:hypothetical protein